MRRLISSSSEFIVLLQRIGQLWLVYIKGQLLWSLIAGALTAAVGLAIGLPGAIWLGLLAGILETVPGVGSLAAMVPAALFALVWGSDRLPVQNWAFALITVGSYVVIQQLGNLVIQPRILGKRLDLPAIVVLISVVLGAIVASVPGAYLAVPLLVTIRELLRYTWRKIKRLPPFPEEAQKADETRPPGGQAAEQAENPLP